MPSFKGTDFEIELPTGCTDQSTYAFAFPTRAGDFRPSVVVKTDRFKEPPDLAAHVEKQVEALKGALADMNVVSKTPGKHGELPAYTLVYDWGQHPKRIRQKQRYIMLAEPTPRVVTMTATGLRDFFDQSEPLFDAVFRSYVPA